jgi:hypothetical protein
MAREGVFFIIGGMFAVVVVLILENAVIGYGAVKVVKVQPSDSIRLNDVHPDFVAAVIEDRARSRVWDPDRRPAGRDVKDDFDDEPV